MSKALLLCYCSYLIKIQKMNVLHHNVLQKRVSVLCRGDEHMSTKLLEAVNFAAQYNVYRDDPFPEFSTPMLVVLGLFYGLIRDDMELTKSMLNAAPLYPQLRSGWLKVWLRDDFNFEEEDVAQALTAVTVLINNGLMNIPMHFFELFFSLSSKYEEMVAMKPKISRTI
ncbi:uncharacterized protein [Halyomorpha halys]|uniref:uncharacterized protein isoform X2 n=1 Tax=Halyomorpha halys TaxID=286706 RepID=UPI0006D518CD|nr:uncharacterized protein LOC106679752 isoform X1 [Halyomorpha halys]